MCVTVRTIVFKYSKCILIFDLLLCRETGLHYPQVRRNTYICRCGGLGIQRCGGTWRCGGLGTRRCGGLGTRV